MRLSFIYENKHGLLMANRGEPRYNQLKSALNFMPPKKVKHSLRVGQTAAETGIHGPGVEAAVLHDYIERGGDVNLLDQLQLDPQTLRVIKMLSINEKTPGLDDTAEVQHHIEQVLNDPNIDEQDKNVAIIVKCADRIDNVSKRVNKNKLTPEYKAASLKLFETLLARYTGDPQFIKHIKTRIKECIPPERDAFLEHLARVAAEVSKWPAWKRNILG